MGPSLVDVKPPKPTNPEFSSWILPFFVSEHMELAPFNRFRSHTNPFNDEQIPLNQQITPEKINTWFQKRRRMKRVKPVKKIIEEMNAAADESTIDLTRPTTDDLAGVPYKYFFFREDVRPAYQGTYTRVVSPRSARKVSRNPAHRGLPDTDYDYDSEAEWQEPEEGDDDLMDEDEMSEDEDADEDMDDFVDNEGDVVKRQAFVGDMEPKSSGLCWEGETQQQPENGIDLTIYRMDVLHDSTTFPIDPFSSVHWSDIGKPSPKKRVDKTLTTETAPMQPPRPPLVAVDGNGGTLGQASSLLGFVTTPGQTENSTKVAASKSNAGNVAGAGAATGKPLKLIPGDLLPAFQDAVSGSELTKTGLVEVLKKQFPKCSKDAIKNTLESIAERRGVKEIDKKWVLIQ